MNPFRLLRRGRRPRNGEPNDNPPPPAPMPPISYIWPCNIHTLPDHPPCPSLFDTAPSLRQHYIHDHHLPPAQISRRQRQLMRKRELPPDAEPPEIPSTREFLRGEDFDPRWPIGPDGRYGQWVVRRRKPKVDERLRKARQRREERVPRGWERHFMPGWFFDEVTRRGAVRAGKIWG